ncbi:MAG: redoxin domain-containing protein [Nanoarchaeota archaeon]
MFFSHKAPKLVWTENKQWINSKPLTPELLKGKIVLFDFWTYSCINCLRTLPALRQMWEKYHKKGLIIIGVHTPEFEFEKELMNVQNAVRTQNIEYPVLNDPERINWENYGNTYWPRAALLDEEGMLVMEHVGESGYDDIEEEIIKHLRRLHHLGPEARSVKEEERTSPAGLSKETYAGSARNTGLGSSRVCSKKSCDEFFDPGKRYHQDVMYLQGDWNQTKEYVEFMGEEPGYILFPYAAREVNIVLDGIGSATVLIDDKSLSSENAGNDVQVRFGKSLVFLNGPRMYNIVKDKTFHQGKVKIIPCKGMRVYAYTFG